MDTDGNGETVLDEFSEVLVKGDSSLTITVSSYVATCDLTVMDASSDWSDCKVEF
ncbi:MAG: hypothetical protein ACI4PG_02950 [Candidatus Ventricola sp.]